MFTIIRRGSDGSIREWRRAPNTTCVESHERIVDGLDDEQPQAPPMRTIAIGATAEKAQESDRSLHDEIIRVPITGFSPSGNALDAIGVVGGQMANGETIRELGAYAGGAEGERLYFLNHTILDSSIPKAEGDMIEIIVTLSFSAL